MSRSQSHIVHLVERNRFLISTGVVVAILTVGVSLVMPLRYSATGSVLIQPRQGFGIDLYTVLKSAERTGEDIARVIETSTFLEAVLASEPAIANDQFPAGERDRRRHWKKVIEPQVHPGSGVLNVVAYDEDPRQARIIAQAVITTLVQTGSEYVGEGTKFKVVDTPIVSRFPVKPNVFVNAIVGFLFGVILAAFRVIFTPEHAAHKRHVPFSNR